MSRRLVAVVAGLAAIVAVPSALPSDGAGFFVGFSDDLPTQLGSAAVTPARELGATAFRITMQWSQGQTSVPAADATRLQRAVSAAGGARLVLAVYGTAGTAAPQDATARDQYCGTVADALARFPAIRDVVIWNEPNKRLFWNPQAGAPAAYEALLARCYDVLHAAASSVNVVGLALSSTGNDNDGSTSPGAFIRGLGDAYRASGRQAPILDTVGFHPYATSSSERPWLQHVGSKTIGEGDWNKLMYNLWLAFDGTRQPLPGSGARLWYLEDGFQTAVPAAKAGAYTGTENVATLPDVAGGEPDTPPPPATSDAPDQATQLTDAMRLAACQPYVGAFFNFMLADDPALTGWQSGALWADLTPKGSAAAFRSAIAEAAGGHVDCDALKGGRPSADYLPPTAPGGLTATASADSVALAWSAATDAASRLSYRVYRNGAFVATTSATSWSDTSVSPATTYGYAVRAMDGAGNLGDASAPATVTTPAAEEPPPSEPPAPSGDGGGGGGQPDLAVSISGGGEHRVGDSYAYAFTLTNHGPGTAVASWLDVALSPTLAVVSTFADRGPGCTVTGGSISCFLDFFPAGLTDVVTVTVRVVSAGDLTASAHVRTTPGDRDASSDAATASSRTPQDAPAAAVAPTVALLRASALRTVAHRGRVARLRFWLRPAGGRASVRAVVRSGRRGIAALRSGSLARGSYTLPWRVPRRARRPLSFCVTAVDAAGRTSRRSCAPIALR